MLKLKIFSVGKTKEKWLEEAFNEYEKRLKPVMHIECCWAKDSKALLELAQKEPNVICLDPQGLLVSSEKFAGLLEQAWIKGGSRLAIIIGGAEGLPEQLKKQFQLISFSPMTFTHQITRLILIEQLYRASEIQKGTQYHK
jgi:23S rRNA (pseudouridine1915-N3)-methyltransferase